MSSADPSIQNDVRWQLIERITSSSPFQRSERLRDLLKYLAEKTLRGATDDLNEHQIGIAVFAKPEDYSIVEDSSVRVHVRQLRLKLHEYFNAEGRAETCIVEIPKGSYTAVFRTLEKNVQPSELRTSLGRRAMQLLPWGLAALFLVTTLREASFHRVTSPSPVAPPWPLSALFDSGNQPVKVVVADVNFGLFRLLSRQELTLQQYLSPEYRTGELINHGGINGANTQLVNYLSGSVLTSYADVKVAMLLTRMSGKASDRLVGLPARSLSPHDFDQGNFVLVGGPASNPWVSYFQDRLNFAERFSAIDSRSNCFENLHPRPGEQQSYCTSPIPGSGGMVYATISFLPLPSGHGSALILQGLHQEGTEAAGDFLADPADRRELQKALGLSEDSTKPIHFEALIRTETIDGAPVGNPSIVSARLVQP